MALAEIRWIVEKRVLLLKLLGSYDVEELKQGVVEMEKLLEVGVPPLYLIVDQTAVNDLPKNFREPINIMTPIGKKYPMSWTFVITNNLMFRFFGKIIAHTFGMQFRPVSSLEEVCDAMAGIDSTVAMQLREAVMESAANKPSL